MAVIYTFPYGLGSATSVRVSNALGAGDARGAVTAARVSLAIVVAVQLFFSIAMVCGRRVWARAFTNEAGVIQLAAKTFPVVALTCLGDGVNAIMLGVVRGCGRQTRAAVSNAFSFWFISSPYLFGFPDAKSLKDCRASRLRLCFATLRI